MSVNQVITAHKEWQGTRAKPVVFTVRFLSHCRFCSQWVVPGDVGVLTRWQGKTLFACWECSKRAVIAYRQRDHKKAVMRRLFGEP